ncbi:porin [Piscinibacter sakaiensis]|nr:porin [Piscinibacter sakaiensis]
MKRIGRGCMALACVLGSTVHAKDGVTVYGVIDVAVEHVTRFDRGNGSVTRLGPNNVYGSRLGFRGSEDLGGGRSVIFNLEMGLVPKNGGLTMQRVFGRESSVGLRSGPHTLLAGRLLNPLIDGVNRFDPTVYAQQSLASQDPGLVARGDNALRYLYHHDGIKASLFYSLGVDEIAPPIGRAAGAASRSKDVAAQLGYQRDGLALSLVFDRTQGPLTVSQHGIGYLAPSLLPTRSDPGDRARRIVAAAAYAWGPVEWRGGLRRLTVDTTAARWNADLWWLGAVYRATPTTTFVAGLYDQQVRGLDVHARSYVLSGQYRLSKRTLLYANLSRVDNGRLTAIGTNTNLQAPTGRGSSGAQFGISHFF